MNQQTFESWAIIELFGHQVIAGKVTEQVIGGQSFVRVDVPEVNGQPGFTKFYGNGAIYAITPTNEETAKAAVAGLRKEPIEVWKLNLPELPEKTPYDDLRPEKDWEEDAEDLEA